MRISRNHLNKWGEHNKISWIHFLDIYPVLKNTDWKHATVVHHVINNLPGLSGIFGSI